MSSTRTLTQLLFFMSFVFLCGLLFFPISFYYCVYCSFCLSFCCSFCLSFLFMLLLPVYLSIYLSLLFLVLRCTQLCDSFVYLSIVFAVLSAFLAPFFFLSIYVFLLVLLSFFDSSLNSHAKKKRCSGAPFKWIRITVVKFLHAHTEASLARFVLFASCCLWRISST